MTAQPPDQSARRRAGVPRFQLGTLEIAIGRLRFGVIAIAVAMIAGFAVLGTQLGQLNERIAELATKMNGIDTTFGVKFNETNANLQAISQRLAAQLKTIEAETASIAKSSGSSTIVAPSAPTLPQPEPTPAPKTAPPPKARP